MHLFYCPDLEPGLVTLPEEEAHHATQVMRLGVGERIGLLNGRGTRAEAELVDVARKRCVAMVFESEEVARERAGNIHLAVAPTKQIDRLEWLVEKAVELGVDRISPVLTTRTERSRLRLDRLERVAIAAMKQSMRAWLPLIDPPVPLQQLVDETPAPQRFFGWCVPDQPALMNVYEPGIDALMLIGPEGDFTPLEAQQLMSSGFTAIALGEARLRTETAALAAITWMSLAQQR